jgi:hypothetical protein
MKLIAIPPNKTGVIWASGVNALKNPIPNTSQIGKINGAASFIDGFPPLNFTPVAAGGVPPFGKDANGLLNQMTAWDQWVQAGGVMRYDAAFQSQLGGYPSQARVGSVTTPFLVWQSTRDDNMTNPDTGGANWQTPVFPDIGTTTFGTMPALTVSAALPSSPTSLGANLRFIGNGTVAPNKTIRVINGQFKIMNNSGGTPCISIDDAGNVSDIGDIGANGTVSAYALTTNGPLPSGGALTVSGNATIAGTLGVTGAITGAANVKGATLTVTGQATADSLQIGTTTHAPGSGNAYFLKGIEAGGTLKVGSFAQLAGALNLGGVDASLYFTDSTGVDWGGMRGFIHRKFSTNPNGNDPTGDTLTLAAYTDQTTPESATTVVTIDVYGGITAAGDIVCGYKGGTNGNNSVIRFRNATGVNTGFIYRDNALSNIVICANNPVGTNPGIGIVIHGSGDLEVSGNLTAANFPTGLAHTLADLTKRLATLEARA